MILKIIGAGLIAYLVSLLFGKRCIPWLKKNDVIQIVKDEVAQVRSED